MKYYTRIAFVLWGFTLISSSYGFDSFEVVGGRELPSQGYVGKPSFFGLLKSGKRFVGNLSQPPHGNKMLPSQMTQELSKIVEKSEESWISSAQRFYAGAGDAPIYYRTQSGVMILTAPMHDVPEGIEGGCVGAPQLLEHLPKKGKYKMIIPVAQANPYWAVLKRRHWTVLEAWVKDGKVVRGKLFDSKPWVSSWIYGGGARLSALLGGGPIEGVFTGHQGFLFNHNDCGKFVSSYIQCITMGGSPADLSTNEAIKNFGF